MKRALLFHLIPLFFIASEMCYPQEAKLLWSDEFNEEGLPDSTRWDYDVGDHGWGNNELEYYSRADQKNSRVENGHLILEAHADSSHPKGYTSARLVTRNKALWKYGYIEVRAKLPTGKGSWPAIWMLPEQDLYGGWPKSGEIDIMEHVGYDPGKVHGTVHTQAYNHTVGTQKGGSLSVPDFNSVFHNYAINWTSEHIDFYIDEEKFFTFENTDSDYKEWPFDHPFYLILNIAVGGEWGGQQGVAKDIWPQRIVIDYVRVYDKRP